MEIINVISMCHYFNCMAYFFKGNYNKCYFFYLIDFIEADKGSILDTSTSIILDTFL